MDLLKVLLQIFHCYVVGLSTGRRVERSYPTRIPKQWKSNVYTAWSGGWNPSPSRNSEQFFIHRNWSINRVRVQKQGIKSTEMTKKTSNVIAITAKCRITSRLVTSSQSISTNLEKLQKQKVPGDSKWATEKTILHSIIILVVWCGYLYWLIIIPI